MTEGFEVVEELRDSSASLQLRGELDMDAAEALAAAFQRAQEAAVIVVDLRRLEFMDSTGLNLLLKADLAAQERGSQLMVVRGAEPIQRLFTITGLDDRLTFIDEAGLLPPDGSTGAG